ncbi:MULTISPECIES: hypothetical protein [unclassified Kitasatospora]|uniref:hypothetical protein n=1 Tax=unclassified Kitasatospora TaxID=2633591 RepID=UPI00070C4D51|nr:MULTISPECIES: hypothetical protein [unclassified Kitasatospora]KQV08728.1 hypothetical protein ASC99_36530 [Kitasatospora sp. Root107]KRB63354.1 hypothetical protein ASE03_33320 [Kitasatospora sp. Root187]
MSTEEAPATQAEAVRELREFAHTWVDGRRAEPATLVDAALRALTAGADTPSLWLLACLMSGEHDQAPALFGQVIDELGFGFHPPDDYWAGRLALARWWAAEIVGGWLDPAEGVSMIVHEVAEVYGWCEELEPAVHAVTEYWERGGHRPSPDEVTAHLTGVARELLVRIPPPAG